MNYLMNSTKWTKEYRTEYMRKWRSNHKEHLMEYYEIRKTPEKLSIRAKRKREWRKINFIKNKEIQNRFYELHPDYRKNYDPIYRALHPEIYNKARHRRRKELAPIRIFMNEWFEGAHLHHMGNGRGIFIPSELHRSIPHSLLNNRNMDSINQVVLFWLNDQIVKEKMKQIGGNIL